MSIGAARDGSPCAVEVESAPIVEAVKPKCEFGAHSGKIEITRKKKRVDSCGMLEK